MRKFSVDRAIEEVKKIGIPIRKYARGPEGKAMFIIGIGDRYKADERICIWPGLAETIEISTNKRLKQAVMSVYEDEQIYEFFCYIGAWDLEGPVGKRKAKKYLKDQMYRAPINLPDSARITKIKIDENNTNNYGIRAKFTVKIPAEERHFLIGYDVNNVFISMLRSKANTVEEAHEILRPKNVPKGSLRQGEFFFIPVPEFKEYLSHYIRKNDHISAANTSNTRTDHIAKERLLLHEQSGTNQYVRGAIKNPRHPTRILEGWHKVVVNCEVIPPTRSQRWD